jgi:histidinol-phosphate aminotransferase
MPSIDQLLRPDIAALEPYTPVAPIEVLAQRLGLPVEQIIKLDANESPYGPSPRATAAIDALGGGQVASVSAQFLEPLALANYPDPAHAFLREKLSTYTS